MNEEVEPYLSKVEECLAGAQSEFANGRYNNATNRAYYAAYNAAIVALIRAGLSTRRWAHDEVQALFAGQLVVRRKLYPGDMRRVLADLIVARTRADYGRELVSKAVAERALRRANDFVRRITRIQR